jgi:hypothetical protein
LTAAKNYTSKTAFQNCNTIHHNKTPKPKSM